VLYNLAKGHYTHKKIFRIVQPNNDITEVMVNFYTDTTNAVLDIKKYRHFLDQHDIRIEPGSTMPSNKWAELGVYLEAFQMGIVDRYEVLKKNPEIFDKEGVMRRTDERQQMMQQMQGMEEQLKNLQGDLQTAQRESISDRKRVEVEKFKSRLSEVSSESKADRRVQRSKLENEVKLEVGKLANNLKDIERNAGSAPEA
jgi:Skp family chaperone for outer membrane proteins